MFVSTLSIALLAAAPARAQEVVQALPGTTDADALAADMRRLGANPRDVDALVDAASLSLRLGDMRAAAALLARAENVDPRSGRVKAGQGSILVQSERPGEALRYFAQAESLGLDPRAFAGDRALAYDLTGEQERAQRDYRTALRDKPTDEEIIRRYALSLGISGQRARALALLDPLVRKSDRGAWRAQAFVLAMTGDVGGASRIAATMMPGGASGLSAFFERLPTLPAIDRAFAVHFGEVRATPERIADARLAPALTPLPRETGTGATVLASNTPVQPTRRDRRQSQRIEVAAAQPAPASVRASPPAARPNETPAPVAVAVAPTPVAPSLTAAAETATRLPSAGTPPVQIASVAPRPIATPRPAPVASTPTPASTAPVPQAVAALPATPAPQPGFTTPPSPQPVATAANTPQPGFATAPVAPAPVRSVPRMSEDSILARIVAGLSIPAAELGVGLPERAVEAPAPEPVAVAAAPARAEPVRPDPAIAAKTAAALAAGAEADRIAEEKRAAARALADRRAAEKKAAADRKALAEKKAAAVAKALADKEAAEERLIARANPERIWVQVAGGAYEGDLPKAYAAVKAKAPAVFGSRGGYTTPLRATNRVLAGPFKTDAEARTFVNDLRKEGVSAFTFTSDAGQAVRKLGAKDTRDDAAEDAPKKKASRRR